MLIILGKERPYESVKFQNFLIIFCGLKSPPLKWSMSTTWRKLLHILTILYVTEFLYVQCLEHTFLNK